MHIVLIEVRESLQTDCFYKVIRAIIHFYKDRYYDAGDVCCELDWIKKIVLELKLKPDIFPPSNENVIYSFNKLNEINPKCVYFYLSLVLSGIGVVEFESLYLKRYWYREMKKDGFVKIVMIHLSLPSR